jgi:C-terminal processing protease CtpA/Prc
MKRAILVSLLLHLSILLVFLRSGGGGNCQGPNCTDQPQEEGKSGNSGNSNNKDERIEPKPLEAMVVPESVLEEVKKQANQMSLEEKLKKEQRERVKQIQASCELWFGGIGVTLEINNNSIIREVAAGYPAEMAGLQAGDQITSEETVRGEVGTPVTILVRRGDRMFEVTIVREKICLIKDEPK